MHVGFVPRFELGEALHCGVFRCDDVCSEHSTFVAFETSSDEGDKAWKAPEARARAVDGHESFSGFDERDEGVELVLGDEAVVRVKENRIEAGEVLCVERVHFGGVLDLDVFGSKCGGEDGVILVTVVVFAVMPKEKDFQLAWIFRCDDIEDGQ